MFVINTKEECEKYIALVNKILGYPKEGVKIGRGIHAPSGMTLTFDVPVEHPENKGTFAVKSISPNEASGLDKLALMAYEREAKDETWEVNGDRFT